MLEHVSRSVVLEPRWGAMQASLFGVEPPSIDPSFSGVQRIELAGGAWIDLLPCWLRGADAVFDALVQQRTWRQHTVPMYERMVAEPRLTSWWSVADGSEPLPVLRVARGALSARYRRRLTSIACNLYRDGQDSVAWHGDRLAERHDAHVAILSVGEPRPLHLRPRPGCPESSGARSRSFVLGDGTLLVMGGTCQATWQHCVPKTARRIGPRMSITFRHDSLGRRRGAVAV